MAKASGKTIRIQYFRSTIGRPQKQKQMVNTLGLRRLNQVVERPDNAAMRGLVAKIPHLIRILDGEG